MFVEIHENSIVGELSGHFRPKVVLKDHEEIKSLKSKQHVQILHLNFYGNLTKFSFLWFFGSKGAASHWAELPFQGSLFQKHEAGP